MKFTIKKNIFLENLLYVSKALSSKNLIPILSGIKMELKEEGLYLTATDNDITIQSLIKIENNNIYNIKENGSIVIQGKYIVEIIRKLTEEEINIEVLDGLKILIYTENSEFNLNGMNANEFPKLELEENKQPINLNTKIFKNIINQTSFATSNQETRPILTGINFKIIGNIMECVATDSYRLAKKIIELTTSVEDNINIVIPSKNLIELTKILDNDDDLLQLHIFNNKILIKFNNILFQSRLLNGTYPDTSKLIPDSFNLKIQAKANEFYNVIDRASLLTFDKEKNIVSLEINNNKMIITSNSPEVGRVEEKMIIIKETEENIKISFSAKYMMDALKTLQCENAEILFTGEIKPIILKDPSNDNLIQLILPIRTY
jgi:DNA polymerase III subunit beta